MGTSELNVVTGAFGYTGKYITRLLLSQGKKVLTLTGHPDRPNPFGQEVSVAPFNFDNPAALAESLRGATTLFNTYWIRFSHGQVTHDKVVNDTKVLIEAAEEAGIKRIVHVSITNASADSPLPYFRGKGLLEEAIKGSKLSYAIIRPAVIFGTEDVLINNIAWLLRRLPVFAIPGSGSYRLQPIFVEDMARLAVSAGQGGDNVTIDAVGPQIFSFDELVGLIASKVHSRARIVHVAPALALFLSRMIGRFVNDVVLTRDEVDGLSANLLISNGQPTGCTLLTDWLSHNADTVGARYASEMSRHYR